MFLLAAICLIGTALAAPAAVPEAPMIPAESHVFVSPYISYPDPSLFLKTLDMTIEPEPKEENAELPEPMEELPEPKEEFFEPKEELPEPNEELPEPEEPKELLPEPPAAPELPKEPKPEPVVVKLEIPKPPSFISSWIDSFPILSNLSSYWGNWFGAKPPKMLYPSYYTGYPGAVIVAAKP